jgi:hypothetical protein
MLHVRYKKAKSRHEINVCAAGDSLTFTRLFKLHLLNILLYIMTLVNRLPAASLLATMLIAFGACNKLPEPDFNYGPEDNPEAGAVIRFTNLTPEASYIEWEFGDESRSTLENPTHIYEEPGDYEVKLTAFNDAGSKTKIKSITINNPTVLAFTITDSSGTIPLAGTELRVYDNQQEWEKVDEPLLVAYANSLGKVEFSNLDPIVYYIWAFRDEPDGYWMSGGYTPALVLNEPNSFLIPCEWFYHTVTKSGSSNFATGGLLRKID